MKKIIYTVILLGTILLHGCIENDIPYATVPLSISEFTVEGQKGRTDISNRDQTVKVVLEETVNPARVVIKTVSYFAEYAKDSTAYTKKEIESSLDTDIIDLRSPYKVKLSLYQDYVWKIMAEQPILRYFDIEGQVGKAIFDEENKIATAYISRNGSLSDISVKRMKLGPEGASMNGVTGELPQLTWKRYTNYSEALVRLKFGDFIDDEWALRVTYLASDVVTLPAIPWVNVCWLRGVGKAETECHFEYRQLGSKDWKRVPQEALKFDGGNFSARISGLQAGSSYEYRSYSDGHYAESVEFTTLLPETVPNMGFEDWSKDGKAYCPWAEGGTPFWDCGNKGSTTLSAKDNVTVFDTDIPSSSAGKYSAKLETRSVLGIIASGNLFVGKYKETRGMNGLLGFGRPFTSYPTRLTGYYKYTSKVIQKVSKGYEHLKGVQDTCTVYIALGDWQKDEHDTYVKILTDNASNKGTYFDVNDPHIIAYGAMSTGTTTNQYSRFEIELDYRTLERRPTALVIVCSASKYGDYFVGGVGSTLWIDDFNLEYDY